MIIEKIAEGVVLELLNYFSDERNLKEGVEVLDDNRSNKIREEVQNILSEKGFTITTSLGLREVANIYNKIEECYGESETWLNLSKGASEFLEKYKEEKSPEAACFLFFYLYVLVTEGYKFVSNKDGRLVLYQAGDSLKKVLSAASDISAAKEVNQMWVSYVSEYSLELEEVKRKREVEGAVKSEVGKRMQKVENIVYNAEKRAGEVEASLEKSKRGQNFVDLSQGFESLRNDISSRIKSLAWQEFFIKIAILAATLVFVFINIKSFPVTFDQLPSLIAPGGLVAILIYFMRLALKEKNNEKARVNEVENKIAIIAFIEEYVGFYAKNKEKAEYAMNSFNDLIFTPISNADKNEQDPKVYDGFEQIINLSKGKGGG